MRKKDDIKNYEFFMEVHDFGFLLPGMDIILRLKSVFTDFKITCFTIPLPNEFYMSENTKHFSLDKYKRWAEIVNNYEWMEIGLHGFSHTKNETTHGYNNTVEMIKASENLLNKVGLEYKKLYVAPFWQYGYDALQALKDLDYTVGFNRDNPIPYPNGIKNFFYNWSVEEAVLPSNKKVIGHGHTTSRGVENGYDKCYNNIINLIPKDAKFGFLSELCKQNEEIKQENIYAEECGESGD